MNEYHIEGYGSQDNRLSRIKSIFHNLLNRKHTRILISFCNLKKPQESALLSFDLTNSKKQWVDLGSKGEVYSCTGVCMNEKNIFSLFLTEGKFHISVIDRVSMKPLLSQALDEIKDGHSILFLDDRLFVVSTGTDEVYSYRFTGSKFSDPEVIWKASTAKADTHHLNSIISVKGDIYVSGFGPKKNSLWRDAMDGYIFNIAKNTKLKEKIYHPHSLYEYDGEVYYCESSKKSLCSLDRTVVSDLDGYTRGICFLDKDTVVIGTSIGRKVSKSEGIILNPADPGQPSGSSSIAVYNLKDGRNHKIDLSGFGNEIYDICLSSRL